MCPRVFARTWGGHEFSRRKGSSAQIIMIKSAPLRGQMNPGRENMNIIKANVAAPDARVAITIARFNQFINDSLLDGAVDALTRIGQVKDDNITVVWVPGAYELPLATEALAKSGKYDAVVALGTVIRGGTAHFEYVAGGASNGLASVAQDSGVPVAFGVLTTESIEQAIERAGTKAGNKGAEAALTALEMINVLKAIKA